MADPLAGDLRVDQVAVGVGVAVDLVEDQQNRLLGLAKLREGLELAALHVAGDDEQDQVGMPGHVAGQGLAGLAADLIDPRRVDQDQLGLFPTRPDRLGDFPTLRGPLHGRPVGRAGLEDLLPHQRIQDRRLPPTDHAERGDLDRRLVQLPGQVAKLRDLRGQHPFLFGREFEAAQGLFQALAGAKDQALGVVELLEDAVEGRLVARGVFGRFDGRHAVRSPGVRSGEI